VFLSCLLCLSLAGPVLAQAPFQPLNLDTQTGILDPNGARQGWVTATNKRMEMTGSTLRVGLEAGGLTAVVFAKGVDKPRKAKPILLGKGEYQGLFNEIVAQRFIRIVVRNPDNNKQWAARLENGKAILED
jgi:hypothetical protein